MQYSNNAAAITIFSKFMRKLPKVHTVLPDNYCTWLEDSKFQTTENVTKCIITNLGVSLYLAKSCHADHQL